MNASAAPSHTKKLDIEKLDIEKLDIEKLDIEEKKTEKLKLGEKILLAMMFGVLLLPLVVMIFQALVLPLAPRGQKRINQLLNGDGLVGMTTQLKSAPISIQTWLNGSFQSYANQWFSSEFGLRHHFIFAANQIDYSVFHMSHMYDGNILIGSGGMLLERCYVDDYCHLLPFPSVAEVDEQVMQIAKLQRRLNKRGIAFVVLVTPSKPSIYPELVPYPFSTLPTSGGRGYDNLVGSLRQYHIPYVDGHTITLAMKSRAMQSSVIKSKEMKSTATAPLFPKGGTHWNRLCAFETTSHLIDAIEADLGRPLPHPRVSACPIVHAPTCPEDSDLIDLMNLMFPDKSYPIPDPVFAADTSRKPLDRAVFVGGSFLGAPVDLLTENRVMDRIDYYYYYHRQLLIKPGSVQRPVDVAKIDWERDIFSAPVIVLEINEATPFVGPSTHVGAFTTDALNHLQN